MEYVALFVWLCFCLLMGCLIHSVMAGALSYRPVQLVAAPGMVVRKFSQSLTALLCGGTVTRVSIYELSSRDIDFRAEGVASVARALVPVAPLLTCASLMLVLNVIFGSPLRLDYSPPALESLDSGGLRGFFLGTWALMRDVVHQGAGADWQSWRLYILYGLVFSLALGAGPSVEELKRSLLGAGLIAGALALLSSIVVRPGALGPLSVPAWFAIARQSLLGVSAAAFAMMFYGMLAAIGAGICVRAYELFSKGERPDTKTSRLTSSGKKKRAA